MILEGIRLMCWAVRCGLNSVSHSIPQASLPSNRPVFPSLPLPSELTPKKNSLRVLPPSRTCSKFSLLLTRIDIPLPTHIDSPSTSSQISVPKLTITAANIFSKEDTSFFSSVDASDGEYRCIHDQNSSLKPRARHCVLT